MFKKKIPKTDPTDSKRLKKELPTAVKAYFKPEDRILLLGNSRSPFDGEIKPMCQTYQKIILIPRPDYGSTHLLWRTQIIKYKGILKNNLDISSLAKVTDGYTPGHIVEAVLNERRIADLSKKPLQGVEFLSPLAKIDPIYKEEEEAYESWYAKTLLGKKRSKAAAGDEEDAGAKGKGAKGKCGKKKK